MTPDPKAIELMPDEQGFYWAKWRIKDAGTEDENEPCSDAWEVVNVFENCQDKNDAEYLRVFVCGVGRSQSLENFYWGEKVTRTSHPREDVKPVSGVEEVTVEEIFNKITRHCLFNQKGQARLAAFTAIAELYPQGIKIKAGGD